MSVEVRPRRHRRNLRPRPGRTFDGTAEVYPLTAEVEPADNHTVRVIFNRPVIPTGFIPGYVSVSNGLFGWNCDGATDKTGFGLDFHFPNAIDASYTLTWPVAPPFFESIYGPIRPSVMIPVTV